MRRALVALLAVAIVAIVVIGLVQASGGADDDATPAATTSPGTGDEPSELPSEEEVAKALEGAPAPLAKLHAQANEILPGGERAFFRRIESLKGYPIVVNVWASWCGPCRIELPSFQRAGLAYGKRVAFLGVDREDVRDDAEELLRQLPQIWPSYDDPRASITGALKVIATPTTLFYDRTGQIAYVHQGPYLKEGQLERDIRKHALRD